MKKKHRSILTLQNASRTIGPWKLKSLTAFFAAHNVQPDTKGMKPTLLEPKNQIKRAVWIVSQTYWLYTKTRHKQRKKSKQKSFVNIILFAFLPCDIVIFLNLWKTTCVHVLVCMFVFPFSVSWECREGWAWESGMHGAFSLSHTSHREGEFKASRLSWTWSIPASSSQGKLIVVWSTNKSQPKKNKWTNNNVWLMGEVGWTGSWCLHPISLCSHAILPLESSQKWSRACGYTGQLSALLEKSCVWV